MHKNGENKQIKANFKKLGFRISPKSSKDDRLMNLDWDLIPQ